MISRANFNSDIENFQQRSDEIVKTRVKDECSTIEASLFGGLGLGDITWKENDEEVAEKNTNKGNN